MSDINISGIPNMGFQGGGGGYFADPFASVNNAVAYNQANLGSQLTAQRNYAAAQEPTQQQLYGPGGFGSMTDYYSSLGASYGRATGGFGGTPGRVGTIGNPGASNPGYLDSAKYDPFVAGGAPIQHYGGVSGNQVFDTGRYLQQNPDVWKSGALPWEHYNQYGIQEGRPGTWSDIFNSTSYAQKNPDVASSGMDPTAHWFNFGQKEQRQGAQTFNPGKYLVQNPDVWKAGADPWQHWNLFGEKEGRKGSWTDAFNPETYRKQNQDVAAAGVDPTAHWYEFGSKEGRRGGWGGQLSPLQSYQGTGFDAFDPNIYTGSHPTAGFGNQPSATATKQDWQDLWNTRGPFNRSPQSSVDENRSNLAADYYAANRDVYDAARASGRDPTEFGIEHIMAFGDDEDRRFFDRDTYLRDNADVAASGMDPTGHWYAFGSKEGRAAPLSGAFSDEWYRQQYPDVAASGMDPTGHWIQFGRPEGRAAELFNTSTYKDPWAAAIPQGRNSSDVVDAVRAASQATGISASALSALFGLESVWDPRANTPKNPNWGVPQLSQDMWGDNPFNGVINGLTWDQYKGGTAAQQIGVYADWLNRSGSMTRGGLDFAAQPEDMQFALLMANQLGGHYGMDWRNRIAAGDMTTPVYKGDPQAGELGNLSPQAFIKAYWDRVARWPTQQTNWGP